MMKKLIFPIAFAIPLAIMLIGMASDDNSLIYSGIKLQGYFFLAFLSSSIAENYKSQINKNKLKFGLIFLALIIITLSMCLFFNKIFGLICSIIVAVVACSLFFRRNKSNSEQ